MSLGRGGKSSESTRVESMNRQYSQSDQGHQQRHQRSDNGEERTIQGTNVRRRKERTVTWGNRRRNQGH